MMPPRAHYTDSLLELQVLTYMLLPNIVRDSVWFMSRRVRLVNTLLSNPELRSLMKLHFCYLRKKKRETNRHVLAIFIFVDILFLIFETFQNFISKVCWKIYILFQYYIIIEIVISD